MSRARNDRFNKRLVGCVVVTQRRFMVQLAKFFSIFVMTLGVSAQAQTNVISRTTPAVNYGHRHSNTPIAFRGTDLMPAANGEADVRSDRGVMEVKAEFGDLQSPTSFGNEYL